MLEFLRIARIRYLIVFIAWIKQDQGDTGGTGLGLAITKSVVSLHNGEIKLYSKVGEGTTFTLRIPLKYKG